MRELVRELALALRERVLPHLGSHAARAHDAEAVGGDVTFAIDAEAERELEAFLGERAPDIAFYSEDRGLVEPSGPARAVLVVDPIDGTRPALAGLESCCVSVAAAALDGERASTRSHGEEPTMGDVTVGCVVEIPSGQVFLAERGAGIVEGPPVLLSRNERIERMFWAYGFRGRPARPLVAVLGDLIDASSVGGASFELGSAAFDMTRVVTGQLDAYVEPGPRLVDELPGMRAEFERVGGGAVLNNSPYDLAAAALILDEAGAILTDAYGRTLSDRPLLGSSHEFQMSVVAAGNPMLHRAVLEAVDAGFARVSG
ncbi:MAG: inositol monophosphatase family protein [Candidatus Limnocylindria bacterium]